MTPRSDGSRSSNESMGVSGSPLRPPRIRAVKKEQQLNLWDWSRVPDPGPRFENMVASQSFKYCNYREDTEGYRMELRFIRDTDR